ncbi:hypothetical protein [Sphingomonas sp.]|uniref:hypothetical protein n=1 Tax=Sphingomonas sp. TaxID=28214 RepID=UPI002E35A436|nr:hypothetical protein [Sphingomonas sp.]HEX4693388.1 hypothetical protein [Sphingomonas sp.]
MDEGLIVLGLVLAAIAAAIYFFYQAFGMLGFFAIAASIVGWKVYKHQREEARKREAIRQAEQREEERQAQIRENQRQQHLREQSDLKSRIGSCREGAVIIYHELPGFLLKVEESLDKAENNFSDKAFSPFWQAIEDALTHLSQVDKSLNNINWQSEYYVELCSSYEQSESPFPIVKVDTVRVRKSSMLAEDRMQTIVAKAQRVYEFSTIYEQRRTTSVLISGFANLGQAINGLRAQIEHSFDQLSSQLESMESGMKGRHSELIGTIESASRAQVEAMESVSSEINKYTDVSNAASERASNQRAEIAGEQAKMAERQLAMLDNMQRKRKPIDWERGNRRF